MTFVIRIEKTANPSGVAYFNFCAVVDGMEEQRVQAHGERRILAAIHLLKSIEGGDWDHIDPDAITDIHITGLAQ